MTLIDARLIEGIRLFNKEEFFECHEVIEHLWLEVRDEYRNFYKGLIQAAVAIHHFKKENLSGALGLYKSSVDYLSSYPSVCLNVKSGKLVSDMKKCFAELEIAGEKGKVKIKEKLIPKIECAV